MRILHGGKRSSLLKCCGFLLQEETEEAPEEEEEEKPKITVDDIKTAPMDFRFPTTNQAKHCYTRYNEFHKCAAEKGEDAKECQKYARYYRSLCPGEWVRI
ncbi:hypothetical protein KC19_3G172300 [Ceratodon purpureus]|uniref:Uncharacterized protein n=1 Tax=Ceratodon purpureus TaxID=3225 RepID=A0A8T0IM76_CERPU|nr:hypothetical protein KC19_3G172300 [Ceratodon purpureus]